MATTETKREAAQRRYHTTRSAYVLPNDEIEQLRLDEQSAAIVETIGGSPFLAPLTSLKPLSRAVDIGCGTGVAAIQLANLYPEAQLFGVDLSPVPERARKLAPPNVRWAEMDILEVNNDIPDSDQDASHREIFAQAGLDYIFGRMLFLGITDWPRYFSTLERSLKPGGIFEHQDDDWTFYRFGTDERVSDNWEWHKAMTEALTHSGLSTNAGTNARAMMEDVGLEVISVQQFRFCWVPTSKAPITQVMGAYVKKTLIHNMPELLRKTLGVIGITGAELEEYTKQCVHDLSTEEGIHQKFTVTVAKKH